MMEIVIEIETIIVAVKKITILGIEIKIKIIIIIVDNKIIIVVIGSNCFYNMLVKIIITIEIDKEINLVISMIMKIK